MVKAGKKGETFILPREYARTIECVEHYKLVTNKAFPQFDAARVSNEFLGEIMLERL
jgi:hypothetical protein